MAGILYHVLPKTLYDFGTLGASAVANLTVATGIDVSRYNSVDIAWRIHTINVAGPGTGATLVLNAFTEAPTSEDPGLEFVCSGVLPGFSTMSITSSTAAPQVNFVTIDNTTSPLGGFIRLILQGKQSSGPFTAFQVAISIDVVAKEC